MGREERDECIVLDGDDVPEPIERDGDWLISDADFAHAILWKDAKRMRKGTFEPGDFAKLRKFLRLDEAEWIQILGPVSFAMAELSDEADGQLPPVLVSLFTLAIRHPGAFRRLVRR